MGSGEDFLPCTSEIETWVALEDIALSLVGKVACHKKEPLKVTVFLFCSVFETGSHSAVSDGRGLGMQTSLALNSKRSVCFCFPNAGINGVCDYTQHLLYYKRTLPI